MDEGALVTAARAGERAAYLRLAGRWQARVRAVAGGLVGPWRGEELARVTLLEGWRRLPTMPPTARFGPWLLGILHELATPGGPLPTLPAPAGGAADRAEATAGETATPDGSSRDAGRGTTTDTAGPGRDPGAAGRDDDGGPGPDDPVVRGLRAGLADLDAEQRAAFLLASVAGLGYDDVATVTGRTAGQVADDVYRARVRLAAVLADANGGSR